MANSHIPGEQNHGRHLIRCPYCVEDGNFKAMSSHATGEGHRCTGCGHIVQPSNPRFECGCAKCASFNIH